jgi:hypothetical protein
VATGGAIVIQTMHSNSTLGGESEHDGWQPGSWVGCTGFFQGQVPWYFRTPDSWRTLLCDAGFKRCFLRETIHPVSNRPLSLLIVAFRDL